MVELAKGSRSAEEVVDEALGACLEYELAAKRAWLERYGPASLHQFQDLRADWRADLIKSVGQLRTGAQLSGDPAKNWGVCVGQKLPDPIPENAIPEAVVDTAMKSCSAEMEKVRANYSARFGAAAAATQTEQLRVQIRKMAIEMVQQDRPTR